MDFSKVKNLAIPEGNVKSISIGGKVVWKKGEKPPQPIKLPYSENFDKIEPNTIPKGWDFITNDTYYGGIFVVKDGYNSYSKPNCIKTDPSATQDCYAILPDFGIDIKKLTLSFWNQFEGESSYLMEVGYMDGGIKAENYVKIADVTRGEFRKYEQKSFKFKDLTIPGSGKGRLAIRYKAHGRTSWYTWTDNIEVDMLRARPNAFRFYNPGDTVNTLSNSGSPVFATSLDGVEWNDASTFTSINIQPKQTLYLRGENTDMNGKTFSSTQPIECHGSIMDLCDGGTDTTVCTTNNQFSNIFLSMSTLLTPPNLPATTLTEGAYMGLFYGCSSLTKAPELPSTIIPKQAYGAILDGCSNINYVKLYATTWDSNNSTNWLRGVASTGTVEMPADLVTWDGTGTQPEGSIPLNSPNGVPTGWTVKKFVPIPKQEPVTDKSFRFENKSNEPRTVSYNGKVRDPNYENTKFIVSEDGVNWEWWNKVDGEAGDKPFETKTINAGEKLYIRGVDNKSLGTAPTDSISNQFKVPNQLEVHGDIHDLAAGGVNGFSKLFYQCHITTVPEGVYYNFNAQEGEFFAMLSATDITKVSADNSITISAVDAKYGLWSLFQDCKQLTNISVKVEANCGDSVMGYMFNGCSNAHMDVNISYYTWNKNCAPSWLYGTAGGDIYGISLDEYGGWDKVPDNWTFNGKPKPKTFNVPYSMNFDSETDENGQEVFHNVDKVSDNQYNLADPAKVVWPDNWEVINNGTSDADGAVYVWSNDGGAPSSGNTLVSRSNINRSPITVILPKFNVSLSQLKVKFWLYSDSTDAYDVHLGYYNGESFYWFYNPTITPEGSGSWYEYSLNDGTFNDNDRLGFEFSNGTGNEWSRTYIDNITVTQI